MMIRLDQIHDMEPWKILQRECPVCKKTATLFAGNITEQQACMACFHKQLEIKLIQENISQWTWERFSFSLSSLGEIEDRLRALIHFSFFQTMEATPELLVENLGFDTAHPLAWYARQKAHEACLYFKDKEKMIKTILGIEKFGSWQQKANMVKVSYELGSTQPEVIEFIERMASDPSPSVRSCVARIVMAKKVKKIDWAKALYEKLSYDKNLLVREACGMENKDQNDIFLHNAFLERKREARIRANRTIKPKASYNVTEMIINQHCNFPLQGMVYELYLSHIPDLLDKNNYSKDKLAALKQNTNDAFVRILAAAINNDLLFKTILERLPRQVVTLLYLFVWEFEKCEIKTLAQKLDLLMEQDRSDAVLSQQTAMPLQEAVKKDPAYFMFQVCKDWSYHKGDMDFICINRYLSAHIQKRLPAPDFGRLDPVQDIQARFENIHEDSQEIFRQLPVILSFIAQGNLKFNKNGNTPLLGSLKKMATACKIDEFYTNGVKDLAYLKTTLLAEFLNCTAFKPKDLEDLPAFIKKRIHHYFSFKDFTAHSSRGVFGYIKRQMYDLGPNGDERQIRLNFEKILTSLPKGEWVSTCNLTRAAFYDGIDFNPFLEPYEFNSLYIQVDGPAAYPSREKEHIHRLSTYDIITLPYVKAMMFLFGALGMVSLGYSSPENKIYRQYKKPWLSIYDGLKYVKLTEFGNYILGRKKQFINEIIISSAKIEIDEQKTMLSIYGQNPIKQMALEAVGQQINGSSYMVNYQSFLKECDTHKDVEKKIQFFRDNIVKKPPAIWENFFKEVCARMNPLEEVPAMSVFRVKPDRELLTLLTTDKMLKKYVIRAENHHMIVLNSDFSKVKNRLAFFGFFIS